MVSNFLKNSHFFNTTALLLESAYLTLACGKIKSLNVGIAGVSQYCNYNEIIRLTCIIESAVRISWKYLSIWYQICFNLHNKYRSVGKLKNLSLNIFIWMKKISKNNKIFRYQSNSTWFTIWTWYFWLLIIVKRPFDSFFSNKLENKQHLASFWAFRQLNNLTIFCD